MPVEQLHRLVDLYLDGHPTDDPVVSPLTADLAGLPPTTGAKDYRPFGPDAP